jgi:hypothetical protein
MINQTHCPLCHQELKTVLTTKDYLVSGEKFDIVECSNCRLRLTSPFPGKEALGGYYESTDGNIYGSNWAAYDTPRHLYHFSPSSIEKIMFNNEFLIDQIYRMFFDSFYISLLSSQHIGKSMISGIWNGFVSWLSCWVNKEKCSSLIYVMK